MFLWRQPLFEAQQRREANVVIGLAEVGHYLEANTRLRHFFRQIMRKGRSSKGKKAKRLKHTYEGNAKTATTRLISYANSQGRPTPLCHICFKSARWRQRDTRREGNLLRWVVSSDSRGGRGIKRVIGNFAGREIASSFPNMFYGLPLRRRRKKNFSNLLLRAGDFAVS